MAHNLRKIPFFTDRQGAVLDAMSRRLRKHYHKGAIVFPEGHPGDCMYILESGQVKIVGSSDAREKVLAYL